MTFGYPPRRKGPTPVPATLEALQEALTTAPDTVVEFDQFPIAASGREQYNTANIAQNTVVTAPNGDTYTVYWDSAREPRIAVKSKLLGTWTSVSLAYAGNNALAYPVTLDSHNNIVIGVDNLGYIHVAGNHHGQALRYIRSVNPYDINAWERPKMVGVDEDSVTYPQFVFLPNNEFLFFYRNGQSGNGDHYINAYNSATKTWTRRAQLFKGTAPVAPDQCAYLNRIAQHTDGSLHIFYMWREAQDATTNTDLSYIKSVDNGVTWTTVTGEPLTLPITPDVTAGRILPGNPGQLTNQSGASVDVNGVPHALFWLTGGVSRQLKHFYWTGTAWGIDVVAASGSGISRAGAYSTSDGKTYALFKRLGKPTALRISPTIGNEITLYPYEQGYWEPTYDPSAPADTLRMTIAPANPDNPVYASTYAGILTVDMTKVETLNPAKLPGPPASVYAPDDNKPVQGAQVIPAVSGKFYRLPGATTTTDRGVADGEFRGSLFTFGQAAAVNTLAVDIIGRATVTGATKYVVCTPEGRVVYVSGPVSVALGVRNLSTLFRAGKGQSLIILIGTQGSTSPSYRWLEGTHDNRISASTTTTALQTTFAGYAAAGLTTGPNVGDTITLAGTSSVPAIAVGIY